MRVPLSWLAQHADVAGVPVADLCAALVRVGLKVERVEQVGTGVSDVVVAQVLTFEELTGFKRPIRYCEVWDGTSRRGVVCGATNFSAGDLVALALPGATLPGGVRIDASRRYGHLSEGMICSARELGVSDAHEGILVLPPDAALGTDVVTALGLRDVVVELEVTPDRGYCLSIRGVAREAATALGVGFHDPVAEHPGDAGAGEGFPVRVDDPSACDRYVARLVGGLDPAAPSPLWMQRRLSLAGMRSLGLAVDVTNHVLLELGQPLHAFDAARLSGGIVVRRATAGESLTTLDGVSRRLHAEDLVIADGSGPVALAGVMGGGPTEVGAATTDLLVESAHFDPVTIARTARRHRLSTEASRRYERGVDDDIAAAAAQAAVRLLARYGGAQVAAGVTDVDHRGPRPVIRLDAGLPGRVAGAGYEPAVVAARLADVGCAVEPADDGPLAVRPPSWRPDLREPIDLVEEVVRLQGFDALPSRLPAAPAGRGLSREQRLRRRLARAVAAAGYVEVRTPPFVAPDVGDRLLLADDDPRRPVVRLANPLSEAQSAFRASLLPGLFEVAVRNVGRGTADVSVFELGPVARARADAAAMPSLAPARRPSPEELDRLERAVPDQPLLLATVLAGDRDPGGWWGPGRAATWADAVQAARLVADTLHVALEVRPGDASPWHPGRCAQLLVAGAVVGWAGELHPRVVEEFGLPSRTCAMELAVAPLLAAAPEVVAARPVSSFPAATLDVAVVVARTVGAAEVSRALRDGAGPLLESLRLFDVYTGPQVGEGHKSLAYTMRLRAPDRTLTVEEAVQVRDAAVALAAERLGATLRG